MVGGWSTGLLHCARYHNRHPVRSMVSWDTSDSYEEQLLNASCARIRETLRLQFYLQDKYVLQYSGVRLQ